MSDTLLPFDDHPEYYETQKFKDWYKYWTDTGSDTYANATRSAIKAYGYDPETQYQVARVTGSKNITKANNLCQDLLEGKNWGIPKMLDFAITQMLASKDKGSTWWRNIMLVTGAFKMQAAVVQNNTIVNNNMQVTPDEAKAFKNDFEQFINDKYAKNTEKAVEIQENTEIIAKNTEIVANMQNPQNAISPELSTFLQPVSNPQQTVTPDVG